MAVRSELLRLHFAEQDMLIRHIRKAHTATIPTALWQLAPSSQQVRKAALWLRDPLVILGGNACKLSDRSGSQVEDIERKMG